MIISGNRKLPRPKKGYSWYIKNISVFSDVQDICNDTVTVFFEVELIKNSRQRRVNYLKIHKL